MINDRIINGLLKDYLEDFGINEKKEETAFEHFCNYVMFTHNCPDAYSVDKFFFNKVHTGEGGDKAIDGILVVVNDTVVTDINQLKEVVGTKSFDAKFVFVQAKTSSNFDSGEMLKVGIGIQEFFQKEANALNANNKILKFKEMADYVFENSIKHKEEPICQIYYVTTGKWVDDTNLLSIREKCEEFIVNLNYFKEVKFTPIDASRLATMYKEIKNAITREIVMSKAVPFPPNIKGVDKAYLGLIQIDEYLKLITDEDGNLQHGLFYDNVRSYLGENPVNNEILETIKDGERYIQFPILNNGVTIVTKNLKPSGDKYALSDFQIVNGCQTSNVIFKCKEYLKGDMMLPVKIVCTENPELINDVIRSTNRQTLVLDEAFESLKLFHKQLQEYYNTYKGADRIYYERRTHEYDNSAENVKKSNIVSLPIQLFAYTSMFLEEPHSVHRYYGELLRSYNTKVFQEGHKLIAYYTSAWLLHRIENALRKKELDPAKYREYRYHFLYMTLVYACKVMKVKEPLRPNANILEKICSNIMSSLSSNESLGPLLRTFSQIVDEARREMGGVHKNSRNRVTNLKDFTLLLKDKVEKNTVLYHPKA